MSYYIGRLVYDIPKTLDYHGLVTPDKYLFLHLIIDIRFVYFITYRAIDATAKLMKHGSAYFESQYGSDDRQARFMRLSLPEALQRLGGCKGRWR